MYYSKVSSACESRRMYYATVISTTYMSQEICYAVDSRASSQGCFYAVDIIACKSQGRAVPKF
jgi:hypothetical protein